MRPSYLLHQHWQFRPVFSKDKIARQNLKIKHWQPATVPGTVHTDLLKCGQIPDPFYSDNEDKLSWICKNNWQYRSHFNLPPDFDLARPIYIVFEGMDTFAAISLNDRILGNTENMFRTYRWEISQYVKVKKNTLSIVFTNPFKVYEQIRCDKNTAFNSEWEPRVYLRKAQYSFGWDWGPAIPTMGIWRPVYLEQNAGIKVKSVRFITTGIRNNQAGVKVMVDCEGESDRLSAIKIMLANQKGAIEQYISSTGQSPYTAELVIPDPLLWWPHGMGKPNLYDLQVTLFDRDQQVIEVWQKKVGIRTIALRRDNVGKAVFQFIINGEPLYIKGANWIPADSFLPRVDRQKYLRLLTMAGQLHMNMIRVWGGGVYEEDQFYQLCDELGLLVWQDFMFACSPYPDYPEFLQNVHEEVTQNVLRLQHHPCLAIWCGNNENEWIWQRRGHPALDSMPGYSIYHRLIPSLLKELDPDRPYWPSSPFGDNADPNSMSTGNRHQWDIWSFWLDYTNVKEDRSLFITEFGFQAPANRHTLESIIPPQFRYPQSKIFEFHNKQVEGNERLFRYLAGHLPVCSQWEDYIYLTQLNQGLALKTCIEHWRGRWPETAGSIIWQLHDCWPVSSWSLIDSRLTPKLSYFFIRQAFSPCWVHIERIKNGLCLTLHSEIEFRGTLIAILVQLSTGRKLLDHTFKINHITTGKENRELRTGVLPAHEDWIAVTTLFNKDNAMIHRNYYTSGRWKHLRLAVSRIGLKKIKNQLIITCSKPAYFVDLYHPQWDFEERGFILLPGEEKILKIRDEILTKDIQIFTLNSYLSK
jgi:beta-mannosidase